MQNDYSFWPVVDDATCSFENSLCFPSTKRVHWSKFFRFNINLDCFVFRFQFHLYTIQFVLQPHRWFILFFSNTTFPRVHLTISLAQKHTNKRV